MRFLSLLSIILFFISIKASSQSCLPLGIEFTTQTQIDSFPINYQGCTIIEGDVKIKGSGISNLDGLTSITVIGGDLKIWNNPDLICLNGLSSLTTIGGSLFFTGNMALKNMYGLDNLESVGKDLLIYFNGFKTLNGLGPISQIPRYLTIIGNDSLNNLHGINHIKSIGDQLSIISNKSLLNLTGLDSITSIGEGLLVTQNPNLMSLHGLDSLVYVGNGLNISFNNSLKSIAALHSITHVGKHLIIEYNPSIKGLNGLENLSYIGLALIVRNNDSLADISSLSSVTSVNAMIRILDNNMLQSLIGLDNITANSITDLYIENNSSLSTCHVQSICDYLAAPNGTVSIYGNAPGCNSRAEVEALCAGGMETEIKVFLQGVYAGSNIMSTNLTALLPNNQPYDTIPWMYSGTETISSIPADLVDWVLVELRDSADYDIVSDTRAGVLLSNGTIKDTNLINGLYFYNIDTGYYYLTIRHRNHISVMTEQPIIFPSQVTIDFSDTNSVKTFGGSLQAMIELEPDVFGMICGDINNDGKLKYSGPDNDRMTIIQQITNTTGSTNITKVIHGYYFEDLDLNSEVKYSGPQNDASIIIQNIISLTGSTSINTVYTCPVMFLYP